MKIPGVYTCWIVLTMYISTDNSFDCKRFKKIQPNFLQFYGLKPIFMVFIRQNDILEKRLDRINHMFMEYFSHYEL